MPLFSRNEKNNIYETDKERYAKERMEDFYSKNIPANQVFWAEADLDTRFEAGDQSAFNQLYGNKISFKKNNFYFNRIRRIVNMITGFQRRNRKSTIVVPRESSDQKTADQFSKILYWANQQEGVLNTISDAFYRSLVTGMSLMHVWMDYRRDPINGNIKVDKCDYNSFIIDPYFKKTDLSDCNGIWRRSYLTTTEVHSLLPSYEDEINAINNSQDGKFQYMPQNNEWSYQNLNSYDEFYYRDFRTQKLLVDTKTGETFEWKVDDNDRLKFYLNEFPELTVMEQEIPTVNMSIIVNDRVVYDGPNPTGIDKYPFVPILGYFNPQVSDYSLRVQGVVRGLRDSQFLYNRRKAIELDILESQPNSGWIFKENAVINIKDLYDTGQGKSIALKEEASMADIQKIQPAQIPPSMVQMSESLAREIQEISGVNEELLGSATDDKAGILSMLRQGAGLTTLQILFDQLDESQKNLGSIMIDLVQSNFTPGKISRIIEENPSDQFYNKSFGKYDAAIEEGLNTSTQKQMQFNQLLHLRETGIPVPTKILIDSSTLQNKNELLEAIQQEEQQQAELQQQQAQLAMQEQQAKIELAQARTVADKGLGIERISRVQENQALATERKAEANKDNEQALLNFIKALKEIETIDIDNLSKLIALSNIKNEKESIQTNEMSDTIAKESQNTF